MVDTSSKINVIVADTHAKVRFGLSLFLQTRPQLVLVGEATNSSDLVRLCLKMQPGVVLVSLDMPHVEVALTLLHFFCPRILIIALHSCLSPENPTAVWQRGINRFVPKHVNIQELAAAIQEVIESPQVNK